MLGAVETEDVGRTPWSARVPLDPLLAVCREPTRASAADPGVRPTISLTSYIRSSAGTRDASPHPRRLRRPSALRHRLRPARRGPTRFPPPPPAPGSPWRRRWNTLRGRL